jgi:hypothetical protein
VCGVHDDLYVISDRVRYGQGRAPVVDIECVRRGTWIANEAINDVFIPPKN